MGQGIRIFPKTVRLQRKKVIVPAKRIRHGSAFGYSFMIQPQGKLRDWGSILHKGNSNKERGPAIFFLPKSSRLHIRVSTEKNWNEGCDAKSDLPMKRWTRVFVQFRPGVAEVYFNGKLQNRCKIGKLIKRNSGPLYAGDPWHAAAKAGIRDVRLHVRPLTPAMVAKIH